jgi:hypothetical protein
MVQARLEAAAEEQALAPHEMHTALWAISRSPCPSALVSLDVLAGHALLSLSGMSTLSVASCAHIVAAAGLRPGLFLCSRAAMRRHDE